MSWNQRSEKEIARMDALFKSCGLEGLHDVTSSNGLPVREAKLLIEPETKEKPGKKKKYPKCESSGKTRFPSYRIAKAAAENTPSDETLLAYQCQACGDFHITSKKNEHSNPI